MKSTFEIPDALYTEVKMLAAQKNKKIKDLLTRGLEMVLIEERKSLRYPTPLETMQLVKEQPLHSPASLRKIMEQVDRERREGLGKGRRMTAILLDTNVLVALSDPQHALFKLVETFLTQGVEAVTSAVAWHEFVRGPLLDEDHRRAGWILQNRILPLQKEDAEVAALLFNRSGRKRASTSDCLIAAVALRREMGLVTANQQDFSKFVPYGLKLLT